MPTNKTPYKVIAVKPKTKQRFDDFCRYFDTKHDEMINMLIDTSKVNDLFNKRIK